MKFAAIFGLLVTSSLLAPAPASAAASFNLLYNFTGPKTGAGPFGALIRDSAGNFYGTTSSGGAFSSGTVYRLSPPASGATAWTETVLHAFRGKRIDGANPDAPLVMDSNGALYGVTQWGGKDNGFDGTIFRLVPSTAGKTAWEETILFKFGPNTGASPVGDLVIGADGSLYGTTCGCGVGDQSKGTVFQLSPPQAGATAWTYRVIHAFTGAADGGLPHAGLTVGADGALYGIGSAGGTANAGVVFSMALSAKGHWKETVLYNFTGNADGAYPRGGVAFDKAGNLYAAAQQGGNGAFGNGAGTVIQLAPPASAGGAWTETTLYTFTGLADGAQPGSTPSLAADGTVYGTTDLGGAVTTPACENYGEPSGCGTVYALHPPAAGKTAWTEKVLHAFTQTDGAVPWGALYQDSTGLYGTTEIGGTTASGTVYRIQP